MIFVIIMGCVIGTNAVPSVQTENQSQLLPYEHIIKGMPYMAGNHKVIGKEDVKTASVKTGSKPLQQVYSYYTDPKFVQYKEHYVADDGKGYTLVFHYSKKHKEPNSNKVDGIYFVADDYRPSGSREVLGVKMEDSMPLKARGMKQYQYKDGTQILTFPCSVANESEKYPGIYITGTREHKPPREIALKVLAVIVNSATDYSGKKNPFTYVDRYDLLDNLVRVEIND